MKTLILFGLTFFAFVSCGKKTDLKAECEKDESKIWSKTEKKCEDKCKEEGMVWSVTEKKCEDKCKEEGMIWSVNKKKCAFKIQKNSAFKPTCNNNNAIPPHCGEVLTGVACGTTLGSGDLQAYCIDAKDTILEVQPYCPVEAGGGTVICTQLTSSQ